MPWGYDGRARRYRDAETGQFLSRERARELVDLSIGATGNATDTLAALVADGMLAPADWRVRMRAEIKGEYLRQYILGRGGREQMTAEDFGSIGGTLSEQYRHLDRKEDNFFSQVVTGDLPEGTIAARSRMYINSAREAYERGVRRRLRGSGYDEVAWVLGSTEQHCADCLALAARGWMPIDELNQWPGDGSTICLTACDCRLDYRQSETGDVFERGLLTIEDVVGYGRPSFVRAA